MEPVPETERMEQFRSSPIPSLRSSTPKTLPQPPPQLQPPPPALDIDSIRLQKPPNHRRSTDPSPTSPSTPTWSTAALAYRPRNTSPLTGGGGHTRSRSAASIAPQMSRTQSLPGFTGGGHLLLSPQLRRPESPSQSPSRVRVPRKPQDEAFPPTSPIRQSVLDQDRVPIERSGSPGLGLGSANRLRRPISPLRHLGGPPPVLPSTPSSVSSSSSYRGYDALTGTYGGSSLSSIPSTPTSTRSRSPSISSLETIPDSPDAEEAALEAERIAQLKADAEAAEDSDGSESKGRSSIDVLPGRGRTMGMGFGTRDKRKRWSVCGAERRGDIDLETIWED